MKICNKCNLSFDDDTMFCKECGDSLDEPKDILTKSTSSFNIKNISVLIVILVIVLGILFKDSIYYNVYINKAVDEQNIDKSIDYFEKALDLQYDENAIFKIQSKLEDTDDFETYLIDLKDVLKKNDFDILSSNIYSKKAKTFYENADLDKAREYLKEAEIYGYDITKFEYHDDLFNQQENEVDTYYEESYEYDHYDESIELNFDNLYFIEDSDRRYLTESELSIYSKEELGYIRNEIFARHGYIFSNEVYQNYFSQKSWYYPNPAFKAEEEYLNEIEKYNVKLIKKLEDMF